MNDWRTKPRNGRTEFIKHADGIKSQLQSGKTNMEIWKWLCENENFSLSKSQFDRYIKKYLSDVTESIRIPESKKAVKAEDTRDKSDNPLAPANAISMEISEWHNINVHTKRLINDLEQNGFTPDQVSSWNEPNDTAIRNRLTQIISKKGK